MTLQLTKLGEAIKSRRKALALSQETLASLANCKPLLIHQIEHGKTNPRLEGLLAILNVLGLQFTLEQGKQILEVRVEK